jgi:hypothetical protein
MSTDIFRFWAQIKPHEMIHPADRDVFDRVGELGHVFDLRCLPGSFAGRLRDAPVVLLYLSPGFSEHHLVEARTARTRKKAVERRRGCQPFSADPARHKWLTSRTGSFGIEYETLRHKVAVLNIGAYHAKNFKDYPLLAALPSSRVSLDWAQHVLFPQAIRGERVVICLRSARYWGLKAGTRYGRSLFAPSVTRGGHMRKKTVGEKKMRDAIIRTVRRAIEQS